MSAVLDPLLLLLIFLGLQLPSGRFLWAYGACLGFFRDLTTGGLFGGFVCSYSLIGWILGTSRHLVEREDPLIQGIWAGLLTGIHGLSYGLLMTLADPVMGWNRWGLGLLPLSMGLQGIAAAWGFPRLKRFLRKTAVV